MVLVPPTPIATGTLILRENDQDAQRLSTEIERQAGIADEKVDFQKIVQLSARLETRSARRVVHLTANVEAAASPLRPSVTATPTLLPHTCPKSPYDVTIIQIFYGASWQDCVSLGKSQLHL
jgi:hypothetical protein